MSPEGLDLGPVGFEPTTKGFTSPRRFHREWTISSPAPGHAMCMGRGVWVRDARACYQGRFSPQVVSAPSAGVPAARLRIAMSAARSKVSLNSSRPLRAFPREGTIY
jgi:hypothetical protein